MAPPEARREIAAPDLPPLPFPNQRGPMAGEQAYCVKCKAQREVKNAREETFENGRRALRGQCAVCGTNITKFLSSKK